MFEDGELELNFPFTLDSNYCTRLSVLFCIQFQLPCTSDGPIHAMLIIFLNLHVDLKPPSAMGSVSCQAEQFFGTRVIGLIILHGFAIQLCFFMFKVRLKSLTFF